jgi:hypothetical protein
MPILRYKPTAAQVDTSVKPMDEEPPAIQDAVEAELARKEADPVLQPGEAGQRLDPVKRDDEALAPPGSRARIADFVISYDVNGDSALEPIRIERLDSANDRHAGADKKRSFHVFIPDTGFSNDSMRGLFVTIAQVSPPKINPDLEKQIGDSKEETQRADDTKRDAASPDVENRPPSEPGGADDNPALDDGGST